MVSLYFFLPIIGQNALRHYLNQSDQIQSRKILKFYRATSNLIVLLWVPIGCCDSFCLFLNTINGNAQTTNLVMISCHSAWGGAYFFDVTYNSLMVVIPSIWYRFPWWFHAIAPVPLHIIHPVIDTLATSKDRFTKPTVWTGRQWAHKSVRDRVSERKEHSFFIASVFVYGI